MRHGLVLGKFMPPHRGHVYLVDFARQFADQLTVVVGSLEHEPIPGELRFQWMKELFPDCRVVHLRDENPQYPHEHPDFWNIWRRSLERVAGRPVDALFASEDYGQRLAQELGARFIPTSGMRELLPISGTLLRERPWRHWDALPAPVRPYFAARVSIFGPESTGKTTLARQLAEHFHTLWVPEFARTWLEHKGGDVELADMPIIVRGQVAAEEALARQCHRVLFCDTDPAVTALWSERLFSRVELPQLERRYHLTLLLEPDLPWEADPVRYLPQEGREFHSRCRELLARQGRRVVEIKGERLPQAIAAVESLLAEG